MSRQYSLILSVLIASCLLLSVATQVPPCFTTQSLNKSTVNLLAGDTHSIDLDSISKGTNVTFSFENDQELMEGSLISTFDFSRQTTTIDYKYNKCTSYGHGLNENDYIFICDSRKIFLATFTETNGTVTNTQNIELDEEATCHSVKTSHRRSKAYVVCTNPEFKILIYAIDLVNPVKPAPVKIDQDNKDQRLTVDIRIMVDEVVYDGKVDTILYIWENNPSVKTVQFRLLRHTESGIVSGGFFSNSNDSVKKVNSIKDGVLVGFYYLGSKIYILTRDQNNDNWIQKCLRAPYYSKFICDPESVRKLENGVGQVHISQFDLNGKKNSNSLLEVFTVTQDTVKIGIFSPGENEYISGKSHSIKGHHLKKITQVVRSNNNFFLTGPLEDDLTVINGLVKYKTKSNSFEEYDYRDYNPFVMVLRKDYFNPHYTDLYTLGLDEEKKVITAFYKIKKNIFTLNTRSWIGEEKAKEVTYTLTCNTAEGWKSTISINFLTTIQVNDNPRFNVPGSILAYTGSKSIYVPTNGQDVAGNAPEFRGFESTDKDIDVDFLMISRGEIVEFERDRQMPISGIRHIGEGYFSAFNDNKVIFFSCASPVRDQYKCEEIVMDIDIAAEHQVFVKAQVLNNIMIVVTSTKSVGTAGEKATTSIRAKSLEDGQDLFEEKTYDQLTELAEIKFLDDHAVILTVGASDYKKPRGVYYLKFKLAKADLSNKLILIKALEEHICPTELSWAPRDNNKLFIASICDQSAADNHVFPMDVDFDNPQDSEIYDALQIIGSRNFRICAQQDLVNIIDLEQHRIYSLDTLSTQESHIRLPFDAYSFTSILRHTCDQENGLLQVIGCSKENFQDCKLVTYRANLKDEPNKRVHSMIDLPVPQGSTVSQIYSRLASSANDRDDDTLTVVVGQTLKDMTIFRLGVDGPHIKIHGEKMTTPGVKNLTWTIVYPGPEEVTVKEDSTLELVEQQTSVTMTLADPNNKPDLTSTDIIDLDQYVEITGPFHSVGTTDAGLTVTDRLTKSKLYGDFKLIDFEDAQAHRDFVFGYSYEGTSFKISIYTLSTGKTTSWDGDSLSKISSIHFVRKSDKLQCFFAVINRPITKDAIWSVCTTDGGATFIENAPFSLETNGYKQIYIIDGPDNGFYFAAYNNILQYSVTVFYFEIQDKTIVEDSPFFETFKDNIADFELVKVGDKNLFLIVGVMYTKQANIFILENDSSNLFKKSWCKAGLVPNVQETHQGIAIKCEYRPDESGDYILCVNTGKNMFSYVTRYELNLDTKGEDIKLISSQSVQTRLRNIVNLKPIRVDMRDDFISMVVKNQKPLAKEGDAQTKYSLFADKYLVLVYKFDSTVKPTAEGESPIRDVYKIINAADLGISSKADESKLDPKFFYGSNMNLQMGINVAVEDTSIRVYNVDSLKVIVQKDQLQNGELLIPIRGLDDKAITVPIKQIFNMPKPDDKKDDKKDNPSDNKKGGSKLFLLIVVCAVLLVIVIVAVGIVMTKRQGQSAEDLNIDDVEKTMKNPDESASGNYSKL